VNPKRIEIGSTDPTIARVSKITIETPQGVNLLFPLSDHTHQDAPLVRPLAQELPSKYQRYASFMHIEIVPR